jgi:hypothetical protein
MMTHELLPMAQDEVCGIFSWWQILGIIAIIIVLVVHRIYKNKHMND